MKFIGFDGKEYPISYKSKSSKSSSGHTRARKLLKELYPNDNVLEEIKLPGSKTALNKSLYADFILIRAKILIEVHGKQHVKYTPFFHKTLMDFIEGQKRDRRKKEWCEINNITYIELFDTETDDEWRDKLCRDKTQ